MTSDLLGTFSFNMVQEVPMGRKIVLSVLGILTDVSGVS